LLKDALCTENGAAVLFALKEVGCRVGASSAWLHCHHHHPLDRFLLLSVCLGIGHLEWAFRANHTSLLEMLIKHGGDITKLVVARVAPLTR
jgi:hypothetical protein